MDISSETGYWLAFNRIPGIGRIRFSLLEKHFGRMSEAWRASAQELAAAGLDKRAITSIVGGRPGISPEEELERLEQQGVKALTWHDPDYPRLLKEIADLPPVLYIRGELTPADDMAVAVVGTRRPTPYGRQAAEELSADLARSGVTVISGLARGIDAVAHRAALGAGGRTLAVMACGLDIVYPREHLSLAREISESGALISDYPLGVQPRGDYFPRRNRIMSGLSLGVLVIEGDLGSGAMITAQLAMEQNREVLAVPGSIFAPQSRGPNSLIQDGAKLVSRVEHVLEELNLSMVPQQVEARQTIQATDTEITLLRYLSQEPMHVDEVCRMSGLPVATVSSILAMLELKGLVKQMGAMNYIKAREVQAAYGG
ncbi:MAG TPA: DNA-processing protein DprA [Dehalococcoidia bacterium]|nr:DNA-processing protein DprA [Dehalococcoidia bacterium]